MAVDASTTISALDTAKPATSDPKSEGPANFQHIKTVLKAAFPNVAGAVTPTHTELNYVDGVTSAIQTQLTAGATFLQSGTGSVASTVQTKLRESVSVKDFGAVGDGTTDDTTAIQAALTTGKRINLIQGEIYKITAALTMSVAGTQLIGNSAQIKQVTAGLPGVIVSVSDVTIQGVYFNSTAAKPASDTSGAYRAGICLHSAILQLEGSRLTVDQCRFLDWTAGIGFHGSEASSAVLAENLTVTRCYFDSYDFGVLARQFDGCLIQECIGQDCEDTTGNPGHLVYITDRAAAQSVGLSIASCIERDNASSSSYKVRNVSGVSINGCQSYRAIRGIEVGYCENVAITNCIVHDPTELLADTAQNCFEVSDSQYVTVSNCVANILAGINVFGFRFREDVGAFGNRYIDVNGCSVNVAYGASSTHYALYIVNQSDVSVRNFRFVNTGTTTPYPIRLTGCTRANIDNPLQALSTASNNTRLITVDSGNTDTYIKVDTVLWNGFVLSSSVADAGTNTQTSIVGYGKFSFPATQSASSDANTLDDYEEGAWTATLTDGTNNATSTGSGTYTKIGRLVTAKCRIVVSSLGSVTGAVFISGLPYASSANTNNHSAAVIGGLVAGMSLGTAGYSVTGYVNVNDTKITLLTWDSTAGTTAMQATEWTASGAAMVSVTYFI